MKKLAFLALGLVLCSAPAFTAEITFPKIDRRPGIADFKSFFGAKSTIPHYNPDSTELWQVDLRSTDLSRADARSSLSDLLLADFDDDTIWPPAARMPKGFDAARIMELGKDPGLGVRALHARGITGRSIGIAIIDQPLLVDHVEYASRLRLYEEMNAQGAADAQMHGPAVASIAVGKSVGVAPGADLYHIACWPGNFDGKGGFAYDFSYIARAIRRVLEINRSLPADRKIRAISISVGWETSQAGYKDVMAAVREAEKARIFVVSCSLEETFGLRFHALGRAPFADPNTFASFEPGMWLAKDFFSGNRKALYDERLWVPMDSRTTASPTGPKKYVFYREGGWSWSVPYIAGAYALACQVAPDVNPQVFWQSAMRTGRTNRLTHDGKEYLLGPIIDPAALVDDLREKT